MAGPCPVGDRYLSRGYLQGKGLPGGHAAPRPRAARPGRGVPCYDVHGEVPGAGPAARRREHVTSSPGTTAGPAGPVAVVVPTYNERDNVEIIASRVRSAVPDAHLLVVD